MNHAQSSTPARMADANSGILDPAALEQIRSLSKPGAPSLLDKVINLYLSNSKSLVERLDAALIAGDRESAKQAAHALASSSGNLGALGLLSLCRQLESASGAADQPRLKGLGAELKREHARVVQALQEMSVPA